MSVLHSAIDIALAVTATLLVLFNACVFLAAKKRYPNQPFDMDVRAFLAHWSLGMGTAIFVMAVVSFATHVFG